MSASQKSHKSAKLSGKKKILKFAAFLLGLLLIAWFVKNSDTAQVFANLRQIGWKFIALILVTFVAQFLATIAWKLSFSNNPPHSLWKLFLIRLVGETLAVVNPTNIVAGESMKAVMLKKDGIPFRESIVSLTISRLVIMLSLLFLLLATFFFFLDKLSFTGSTAIGITGFSVIALIMGFFIFLFMTGRGIFSVPARKLKSFFPSNEKIAKLFEKAAEIDSELAQFYDSKKGNLLLSFILSSMHWLMGGVEFYFILTFMGIDISLFSAVTIEMGVNLFKNMGAFIPGQVGVEEYGNKMMLELMNISTPEIWIAVSLLRRARQMFWICLGAIVFALLMRIRSINKGELE